MKIWIRNRQKRIPLDLRKIRRVAKKILADLALPDAELSILFIDDLQIRELNRRYLRQSNRFGLDPREMVTLLMVHGILHLTGYEHEGTRKGAREMALKQKELFQKCRSIGKLD